MKKRINKERNKERKTLRRKDRNIEKRKRRQRERTITQEWKME